MDRIRVQIGITKEIKRFEFLRVDVGIERSVEPGDVGTAEARAAFIADLEKEVRENLYAVLVSETEAAREVLDIV